MREQRRLVGSHCPLCGELDLPLVVRDNKEMAICPPGVLPAEAHTVIVVRELRPPKGEKESEG